MAINFNTENNPMKDANGRWRTTSLFWDWRVDGYTPLWCLEETDITRDGVTYPSLHKIFLSYPHVPGHEYEFVQEHLGSWTHWLRLQDSPRCMEYITKWREELEVKNQAQEIRNLIIASRQGDTSAAKFLVDKLSPSKRGRPSNVEKQAALKEATREHKDFEDDLKRIGLKVVGNG